MKKPILKNLRIDREGTLKIRNAMAKTTKIKITINIDEDILRKVRKLSDESGIPYQKMVNMLLSDSLERKNSRETRMARLEREVNLLKKKFTA